MIYYAVEVSLGAPLYCSNKCLGSRVILSPYLARTCVTQAIYIYGVPYSYIALVSSRCGMHDCLSSERMACYLLFVGIVSAVVKDEGTPSTIIDTSSEAT